MFSRWDFRGMGRLLSYSLFLLLIPFGALAQSTRADAASTVADSSRAVAPRAEVTIANLATHALGVTHSNQMHLLAMHTSSMCLKSIPRVKLSGNSAKNELPSYPLDVVQEVGRLANGNEARSRPDRWERIGILSRW